MIGFRRLIHLTFLLTTCFIIRTLPMDVSFGCLTAGDRTMHFICCCLLFLLSCVGSIVDIACISSFLSFSHILLGFVVNTALYRRVNMPPGGSRNAGVGYRHAPPHSPSAPAPATASLCYEGQLPGFPLVTSASN